MLCNKCNIETVIGREINRNGHTVIVERCPKCLWNPNAKRMYLPKNEHPGWEMLPLIVDYSEDAMPCEVFGCDRKDTEFHHFAPRHLFEDADSWPGNYLCQYHHKQWHQKVTPDMYRKKVDA